MLTYHLDVRPSALTPRFADFSLSIISVDGVGGE